jgi:ABC-type Mn2+/Zn2+ transport system permease subunit
MNNLQNMPRATLPTLTCYATTQVGMRQDVIRALAALITAAFGLVAALAWNTSIQEIFKVIFGDQSGVVAMIIYAVIVTVLAVIATLAIGRAAAKAGVKDEKPVDEEVVSLRTEVRSLWDELRRIRDAQAG